VILVVAVLTSTDHASIVLPGINMCIMGFAVPVTKMAVK